MLTAAALLADVWLPWGTADDKFTQCRLIKQDLSGQNGFPFDDPTKEPPRLTRIYEELQRDGETQVGNIDITITEAGLVTAQNDLIQFSTGTSVYGRVGYDTIVAGTTTVILKTEERSDDGTLITIKRGYISAGQIAQTDEIKENGSLLLTTIKSVYTEPATPGGYTVIRKDVEDVNGLKVYTYTFAKGSGLLSRQFNKSRGGTEALDSASPTPTVGAVVETVKYLSASTLTTNPITSALGGVCFSVGYEDQDGYRIWTASYAVGLGVVELENDYRFGGKVVTYHRIGLGSAPSTPAATIGGTVTLVSSNTSNTDGYVIYDYRWAEGLGEISRETEYRNSVDQGTIGLTIVTIKYVSAVSVGSNPISSPGGSFVLVKDTHEDQDGFRMWTAVYGMGQGTIGNEKSIREGGKLVIYNLTALGAAPSAPSPTIGGTLVLIKTDARRDRFHEATIIYEYSWAEGFGEIERSTEYIESSDSGATGITRVTIRALTTLGASDPTTTPGSGFVEVTVSNNAVDGYLVWNAVWAKGTGIVTKEVSTKNSGNLIIYRQSELNASGSYSPTAPSATIGGTVTLVSQEKRNANGYFIYNSVWAEGFGTVDSVTRGREDGSIAYTITTVTATATTPAAPAGLTAGVTAFLVELSNNTSDGYYVNRAIYIKPPANFTVPVQIEFRKPGLVTAGNPPSIVPPVTLDLMGTNTVTFATTKTSATPYKISSFAQLSENFTRSDTGLADSQVKELPGYLGSSSFTGSNITYRGIPVSAVASSVSGSNPTSQPTGTQTTHVRCTEYLTDINGTRLWKNEVVTADVT